MFEKITKPLRLVSTVGFILTGITVPCYGQAQPPGKYRDSCDNCRLKENGAILECDICYGPGKWRVAPSKLRIDRSRNDPISNCNGTLKYGRC
jgi:hypothetical protein